VVKGCAYLCDKYYVVGFSKFGELLFIFFVTLLLRSKHCY